MRQEGLFESTPGSEDPGLPFPPAVGCLVSLAIGLAAAGILALVAMLVSGREIRASLGELSELRVWMVRDEHNDGLGVSRSRAIAPETSSGEKCVETAVHFYLWRSDGSAEDIRFCECYRRGGDRWLVTGDCPP